MLSRDEFEKSCKTFLDKFASSDDEVFGGWSWNEHAVCTEFSPVSNDIESVLSQYLPRLGYLSRSRFVRAALNIPGNKVEDVFLTEESENDAATAVTREDGEMLEVSQYIVYSATFQVPAFYFSMHATSPLAPLKRLTVSLKKFPRWFTAFLRCDTILVPVPTKCLS